MSSGGTSPGGSGSGSGASKLYDYEVTGSAKASIDTAVDGTVAANFAGYTTLEVLIYSRTDEAAVASSVLITLNNDTGNNYFQQDVFGNNVTAGAAQSLTRANWALNTFGATAEASFFPVIAISLPNYLGTVGYKTAVAQVGRNDATAADNLYFGYVVTYKSVTAVSRLKVVGAPNLVIGSRLLIYGK